MNQVREVYPNMVLVNSIENLSLLYPNYLNEVLRSYRNSMSASVYLGMFPVKRLKNVAEKSRTRDLVYRENMWLNT